MQLLVTTVKLDMVQKCSDELSHNVWNIVSRDQTPFRTKNEVWPRESALVMVTVNYVTL